jgi:flagellar hook-associated protein 1 FlgK
MSLFSSLGSSLSGLKASSAGIQTATHNVANASTEGFTRRSVALATANPVQRQGTWFGQGVQIAGIGRAGDTLLLGRLSATTGEAAASASEHGALSAVEGMFEPSAGLSLRGAVDGLFDAFQAATADPADAGLRSQVVGAADRFAKTVSGIAKGIDTALAYSDESITAEVDQVNRDLAEVAALNKEISRGGGALAQGDLADRRDLALGRLAGSIGATAHFQKDGSVTVMVGGHAAVSGDEARTVGVRTTPGAPPAVTLSVDRGTVTLTDDVGGAIGGELSGRAQLVSWKSELDTLAQGLGDALNAQNAAGFVPGGSAGGPLFQFAPGGAAAGISLAVTDGSKLAFAGSPTAAAGDAANLNAMIGLEGASVVGGASAGAFASRLTSRVGTETSLASVRAESTAAASADAQELYVNLTSVDLDEQAVQLIQYQTAYQAAAKVVQITDDLLGTLMQIVR